MKRFHLTRPGSTKASSKSSLNDNENSEVPESKISSPLLLKRRLKKSLGNAFRQSPAPVRANNPASENFLKVKKEAESLPNSPNIHVRNFSRKQSPLSSLKFPSNHQFTSSGDSWVSQEFESELYLPEDVNIPKSAAGFRPSTFSSEFRKSIGPVPIPAPARRRTFEERSRNTRSFPDWGLKDSPSSPVRIRGIDRELKYQGGLDDESLDESIEKVLSQSPNLSKNSSSIGSRQNLFEPGDNFLLADSIDADRESEEIEHMLGNVHVGSPFVSGGYGDWKPLCVENSKEVLHKTSVVAQKEKLDGNVKDQELKGDVSGNPENLDKDVPEPSHKGNALPFNVDEKSARVMDSLGVLPETFKADNAIGNGTGQVVEAVEFKGPKDGSEKPNWVWQEPQRTPEDVVEKNDEDEMKGQSLLGPLKEHPLSRERMLKVLLIGDPGVGKTSFVQRYTNNDFRQDYKGTVGVDFAMKVIHYSTDIVLKLQLWDIAGQERFTWMTRVYYKDAKGCIIMFDETNKNSFVNVSKWKSDLDTKCSLPNGFSVPCLLLANKCDLKDKAVSPDEIEKFSKDNGFIGWTETSAKDDLMVKDSVKFLIDAMVRNDEHQDNNSIASTPLRLNESSRAKPTSIGCLC